MKIRFETYDDGEIDLLVEPEFVNEKVLLASLALRNVDNLGLDDTNSTSNMIIRFKTEWND